jgi:hypothetical protein
VDDTALVEKARAITAVAAIGFSVFYYRQGSLFASGMMAGVSLTAFLRFIGNLLTEILE